MVLGVTPKVTRPSVQRTRQSSPEPRGQRHLRRQHVMIRRQHQQHRIIPVFEPPATPPMRDGRRGVAGHRLQENRPRHNASLTALPPNQKPMRLVANHPRRISLHAITTKPLRLDPTPAETTSARQAAEGTASDAPPATKAKAGRQHRPPKSQESGLATSVLSRRRRRAHGLCDPWAAALHHGLAKPLRPRLHRKVGGGVCVKALFGRACLFAHWPSSC